MTGLAAWQRACEAIGARGTEALHAALWARYGEPHRAYHSRQHLAECLALFDGCREVAQQPAEVELALWFHDAIYDVHRHDNEARSAQWAREALRTAGAAVEPVERIAELVLATRHSAVPRPGDEALLVDIDLAILGAAPARFAEYESQIRAEYAFVPAAVFAQKRAAVLAGFQSRAQIYATAAMRERFEQAARSNLGAAIAAAQAG